VSVLGISNPLQGALGVAVAAYSYVAGQTSAGLAQFRATYETSPIFLSNGIAGQQSGGTMAFNSLLPAPSGFAYFRPVPGASLIKNRCATYPMFNQMVAGNAMIAEGVQLSMEMECPANPQFPYLQKSAYISALIASLKKHNVLGGTYSVATPAFFYDNGVMLDFRDVTGADKKQAQVTFQIDFYFPLITIADAQAAMGTFLQTLGNGAAINGSPSWSTGALSSVPSVSNSALTPPTIQ